MLTDCVIILADDHIPVYVACEDKCMEIVHGARELLDALINVMESHYDAHSWEKGQGDCECHVGFSQG